MVAREWGQYGIRVNVVSPSAVTDNVKASLEVLPEDQKAYVEATLTVNPLRRAGDPYEDVTPAIVFLASEEAKWITGQNLNLEGGGNIHS